MNDSAKDKLGSLALGALGGACLGFLSWQIFKVEVDRQVTASVDAAVDQQIQAQFASLGLNANMAAQIRTLMSNLDSLGVLSALAAGTTPPRTP